MNRHYLAMNTQDKLALIEYLETFISEERKKLFYKILDNRTRRVTVLIEDLFQPHNASAILRSCDCFGVQDVHIIENRNKFKPNNQIDVGSSKWLNTYKYNKKDDNTLDAILALKAKGYRIIATTPHEKDQTLDQLDIEKGPMALMFGTELEGLTDIAKNNADEFVKIPMYGFTESFNISVSAALCLHHITEKLRKSNIDLQLNQNERIDIHINWLTKTIKSSKPILKKYFESNGLDYESAPFFK